MRQQEFTAADLEDHVCAYGPVGRHSLALIVPGTRKPILREGALRIDAARACQPGPHQPPQDHRAAAEERGT